MTETHPHFGELSLDGVFIDLPDATINGAEVRMTVYVENAPAGGDGQLTPELVSSLDAFVPLATKLDELDRSARSRIAQDFPDDEILQSWIDVLWEEPETRDALTQVFPDLGGPQDLTGERIASALSLTAATFSFPSPEEGDHLLSLDYQLEEVDPENIVVVRFDAGGAVAELTMEN